MHQTNENKPRYLSYVVIKKQRRNRKEIEQNKCFFQPISIRLYARQTTQTIVHMRMAQLNQESNAVIREIYETIKILQIFINRYVYIDKMIMGREVLA